jgi:hypothetical protein
LYCIIKVYLVIIYPLAMCVFHHAWLLSVWMPSPSTPPNIQILAPPLLGAFMVWLDALPLVPSFMFFCLKVCCWVLPMLF